MSRPIKFRAWDRRNKSMYRVVSIAWTYGDILRQYNRDVPDGDWLPESMKVILGNGKTRRFNYSPQSKTYIGQGARRSVLAHADRHIADLTLLQYTGLKDKNGVEIYEGDIVKIYDVFEYGDHELLHTGAVEFGDEALLNEDDDYIAHPYTPCFYLSEVGQDEYGFGLGSGPDSIEVIGNIYENPELLEPQSFAP